MGFRGKYATSESYGGGISGNIAGSKALPVGEAMQAFAAAMKMRKIFLYQKNIHFANNKTHSCRITLKMVVFNPYHSKILLTCG
ncbi:hypothetical protein [Leptospira sp. severe_002]|uniref:hypothetical protein n=1 Tax=Leptospira sp. severe_002 TaxID=2838237 RepID=UPI001E39C38E|nr:hypothetical protein [Leptospira sp. severe_002]